MLSWSNPNASGKEDGYYQDVFSIRNQVSEDNQVENQGNQVLDFGFITAVEMLKAPEAAESIGSVW